MIGISWTVLTVFAFCGCSSDSKASPTSGVNGPSRPVQGPTFKPTTVIASTTTAPTDKAILTEKKIVQTKPADVKVITPLTFPRNTFLSIESLVEQNPKDHRFTIVYFDGMQGAGAAQLERLNDKGFLNGIGDYVRLVAPVMATTDNNQKRLWFPWVVQSCNPTQEDLGDPAYLDEAMNILLPIIDREAALLNGDYSRIFLVGYSQGGMMASWLGLMGNRSLGAVIILQGAFPYSRVNAVSPKGRDVPFHHVHDPRDIGVRYDYAQRGLAGAQNAGARGYREITNTEVPGNTHHGLSTKILGEVNEWLTGKLRELNIL